MIEENNLIDALESLGFVKESDKYIKYFPLHESHLKVDFRNKLIEYPESKGLIINERQTCNFSDNENFVVLECVNRLLDKGYQPKHIELEPKWKLGHGASGGRADILVKDHSDKPLLLIECKTWGREFEKAWKDTLNDGDQLFSYAQQIADVKFLCLYTSELDHKNIIYKSNIIAHEDNEEYLKTNAQLLSFKEAKDLRQRFAVWRDTYKKEYVSRGIFEDNIQAYNIGKSNYTLDDLDYINREQEQKQYHNFATILRQYNVSGRENAFDVLVNLLLCKIVDESKNALNLQFYWKGISRDSYFDLQDRLQRLYQVGMREFLGEEVTYIDNAAIDRAFRYIKRDPNITKTTIKDYFRQLKFFTNSDFAFIDVHNERLFYENAKILLAVIQMWQDLRIKSEQQNQFLGDMFEGFLDAGVKQSEGQFFTPMPICRFILSSLPLENIIKDNPNPPLSIDYACGAGHFLTELAIQMKPLVEKYQKGNLRDYYAALYGIEKEYRLSKVAKVSAFMYGHDDIKIIYGDALSSKHKLKDGSFQILIANPPYSVKGFLETLSEEERYKYELHETIANIDTSNSIETFFIERAKQLLTNNGVAAIIVPSSVLSNGDATYTKARELILKYFDIVAIVELGSGTFGKTGTNTVTLFLRKKEDKPTAAEYYWERVEDWFNLQTDKTNTDEDYYQDDFIVKRYCQLQELNYADYLSLLTSSPNQELLASELFFNYRKAFDNLTTTKNLLKSRTFRAMLEQEQIALLQKNYVSYCREQEMEKLYYFALSQSQNNPVVVVKAPADNKEQKQFLGYEWSSAKGNEGIKLIRDLNNHHVTPLYDETNRYNPHKINTIIQSNFNGESVLVPEELRDYVALLPLAQMLDFSRVEFNKQISLAIKDEIALTSKYPLVKLGALTIIESGGTPSSTNREYWDGEINWATLVDTKDKYLNSTSRKITEAGLKNSSAKLLPLNTVLFSSRATIGEVCIAKIPVATNQGYKNFICDESKLHYEYLYYVLKKYALEIASLANGMTYKEISKTEIANFKIPLPPLDIQNQIVAECQAIDDSVSDASRTINKLRGEINDLCISQFENATTLFRLGNSDLVSLNPSKSEIKNIDENTLVSFIEMASVSNGGYIEYQEDRLLKDLKRGSYTYFAENDIIIAKITPCMENGKCALAKNLTNRLAMGSSEFHVIRCNESKILSAYVFYLLNRDEVRQIAESHMTGASGHRRVPVKFYENYEIPVPPLEVQQQLVDQIEVLEAEITAAQAIIAAAPAQKQAILHKYLD